MDRVFILSPAKTNGKRASILMNERAAFDLAKRLHTPVGAPLGEVFSFLSGLYFRGKYAYSKRFGRAPNALSGQYVITSNCGLMNPAELVSYERLKAFGDTSIDPCEPRYTEPLRRSARALAQKLPPDYQVVLLGSIATNKYAEILVESFKERLMFPREFVGRRDMSRGGVLLRAVNAGQELEYVSLATIKSRRGERPPKLPREI
jgi:hypothetical protein